MTVKSNIELIETMTLLLKVQIKSCSAGILAIEPMVEKVCDPFLKKGLMMCVNGYDSETINMILKKEVDSADTYKNIVVEGCEMVAESDNPTVMREKFKSHLSVDDQCKLGSMAGKLVEEWEEMCERGEVVF